MGSLIDAAADGQIDVAVSNITITETRAERVDFTHPWFDGGMRIMVGADSVPGIGSFFGAMVESGHLRLYGWIAGLIVLGTFALTVFDRRFNSSFPRRWHEGLAESFYNVMSVATSGKMPARAHLFGWVGRIWQALWLVSGVAVLAYVTSSVTSVMTTLSLTRQISSLADLPGKTVGVMTGSVQEDLARAYGFRFRSYIRLQDAANALQAGQVDALVADAPVLEYYAAANSGTGLSVVGPIFEPDKYGFALPPGSLLTKELTLDILGAQEDDTLPNIKEAYFGRRD